LTKYESLTYDKTFVNSDYARITGVEIKQVKAILKDFPPAEFRYRNLSEDERDDAILCVLKKVEEIDLPASGINDVSRWEKGWGEVLEKINNSGFSIEVLRPQYFHYDILRYGGNYIKVPDANLEFDFYTTIRRILFRKYFNGFKKIIEFGCGTGTNLMILCELFPGVLLTGCDWAHSSQQIIKIMSKKLNAKIEGVQFNMLTLVGKENVEIDSDTALITMHAMEQLGTSFGAFLENIMKNRPGIVFHIEPILELYEPDRLFDTLAVKYHEKRNYLKGYLTALKKLESENKIEILEIRRLFFGSLFHEGYSLVVWKIK
jgi:hypothetical protein